MPSDKLDEGVRLFNEGRFFDAHEAWEAAWRETPYPERLLYLALTKLAAGLEQAKRGGAGGTGQQVRDALRFLGPFTPSCGGLDTGRITTDADDWLAPRPSTPKIHPAT